MGMLKRLIKRKSSKKAVPTETPLKSTSTDHSTIATEEKNAVENESPVRQTSSSSTSGRDREMSCAKTPLVKNTKNVEPCMDMMPSLINDLETTVETSGEKAGSALRMLFALSEHSSDQMNREDMVRSVNGKLIPVLLDFLKRCSRGSGEQYLTLLVLNNVSIPTDNKRLIAMDCDGLHILSRLLCEDPSSHLVAIILVNLTFADAELRKELVSPKSEIQLIDALAYVLWIACATPKERQNRAPISLVDGNKNPLTPREVLAAAMEEDKRLRSCSDLDAAFRKKRFDPKQQLFPETARWCLCALKNLTRPGKDSTAARGLIDSGIVPLILRIVTVAGNVVYTNDDKGNDSVSNDTPTPIDPLVTSHPDTDADAFYPLAGTLNIPSFWESNTIQDAALFTLLNLATFSGAICTYLREEDTVHTLSLIADYSGCPIADHEADGEDSVKSTKQQQFQCLKARMTLSYLVGAEGHYGQPRNKSASYNQTDGSVLLLPTQEAEMVVDVLADTLHNRGKEGAGGYSAATFTLKSVLFAIRCLLTNHINQVTFSTTVGVKLNALLFKTLALHSMQRMPVIDTEAAEHACFSLYIMSNYGFDKPFLPASMNSEVVTSLAEKVLTRYLQMESTTSAGYHASEQLLLRLKYIVFEDDSTQLELSDPTDFELDSEILTKLVDDVVSSQPSGAKPNRCIFERPILRSRAPKKGKQGPWDEQSTSVRVFPNALVAIQELSYGSQKVRHMDRIDDILIANNISSSANGEKTESYNYWWSWQDTAPGIQTKIERNGSSLKDFMSKVTPSTTTATVDEDGPITIFGFSCGFCG